MNSTNCASKSAEPTALTSIESPRPFVNTNVKRGGHPWTQRRHAQHAGSRLVVDGLPNNAMESSARELTPDAPRLIAHVGPTNRLNPGGKAVH